MAYWWVSLHDLLRGFTPNFKRNFYYSESVGLVKNQIRLIITSEYHYISLAPADVLEA